MQPARQPDDLDSILHRFSHWSGGQPGHAEPATRPRREMVEGVREIPYEEALRQLRYRRAEQAYGSAAANSRTAERGTDGCEATSAEALAQGAADDGARRATGRESQTRKPVQHRAAAEGSDGGATAATKKAGARARKKPRTEFRQVLTKSLGRRSAGGSRGAERELRVSVRLSQGEEQELQKRAGAAGLTISAYLRKCALGIEEAAAGKTARMAPPGVQFTDLATEESESLGEEGAESRTEGERRTGAGAGGWLSRLRQRFLGAPAFEESA